MHVMLLCDLFYFEFYYREKSKEWWIVTSSGDKIMHEAQAQRCMAHLLLERIIELRLVLTSPKLLPADEVNISHQQTGMQSAAHFFFVVACSANTSTQCFALNSRKKRGSLCTPSVS